MFPVYSQDGRNTAFEVNGRVVTEATGEPVFRALVQIETALLGRRRVNNVAALEPQSPSPEPRSLFTDASGAFHFTALPSGKYRLSVTRPQFQTKTEIIEIETASKDLEVHLTRFGLVTGKAVDADGNAVRGVNIVLYSVKIVDGRRSISQDRNVVTDDLGEYRLWNIAPRNYILKAAGRGTGTGLYISDALPSFSAAETFTPMFFGGSKDWRTATPFEMHSGSKFAADFRLSLQPAHRIRGTVTGMTLFRKATFELFDLQGNQVSSRAVLSGSGGSFQLLDVLSGSYIVRVKQGDGTAQVFGETQVTVGDANAEGVTIELTPGVEVKVITDCKSEKAGEREGFCGAGLTLYHAGGLPLPLTENRKDGASAYSDVPVGTYEFQALAFGGYIRAILIGGQTLRPGEKLHVFTGMAPIEMQMEADGGSIEAKLDLPASEKTPDLQVLAVPMFESYAGPSLVRIGAGQFNKLAPGEYQVYAFPAPGFWNIEYRNPEALRNFFPSASVKVEPNGRHQVVIKSLSQ